jgi:hypothetical protein
MITCACGLLLPSALRKLREEGCVCAIFSPFRYTPKDIPRAAYKRDPYITLDLFEDWRGPPKLIFEQHKPKIVEILESVSKLYRIKAYLETKILFPGGHVRRIISEERTIDGDIPQTASSLISNFEVSNPLLTRSISLNILPESHWGHPCAHSNIVELFESLGIECVYVED